MPVRQRLGALKNHVAAAAVEPYVPPLQLTEGQPAPIAMHGSLSVRARPRRSSALRVRHDMANRLSMAVLCGRAGRFTAVTGDFPRGGQYMSFDAGGDAGTARAIADALEIIEGGEGQVIFGASIAPAAVLPPSSHGGGRP
jgi:hypothetical protein